MEAIQRRGYRPRETTKVTPDVADPNQVAVVDGDVRIALNFLKGRPLGRSDKFIQKGPVLLFVNGNRVF